MVSWVLFFFTLLWIPSSVNGATDPSDVSALNVLYSSLNSPSQLTGWSSTDGDPCGHLWKGITCSGPAVTQIILPGLELTGTLGYMLASMTSLIHLDLSNNNLGGGNQIPYNLPPNLQQLNLAGNTYGGSIPYSLSSMTSLKNLFLGHNQLQGDLNDIFGKLSNISVLDLSFNSLTGNLPKSFGNLSSLTTLYLENNQLMGTIDVLASLPLKDLNVANNRFTGWIPDQLKRINNLQTGGNAWSSGPAPPPPPGTPPPSRKIEPGHRSGGSQGPTETGSGEKKSSGFGVGSIIGILVSVLVFGAILAFFLVRHKQKRPTLSKMKLDHVEEQEHERSFTPLRSNEFKGNSYEEYKPIEPFPAALSETLQSSPHTSHKLSPVNLHKSFDNNYTLDKAPVKKAKTIPPIKATSYSVADLQIATDSFSIDNLLGDGSLGRVYRAQFNDGKVLAVKKMDPSILLNQSSEDFIEMVSNISNLHHPNISELVGYCCEHEQNLLVYEFHKNGSLHDLLHILDEDSRPLVWNARVKIALGIARALEYLHEVLSPSLILKNLKSSNILLDAELNPHLSDCGLASFVHNALDHDTSSGYTAPEVSMSGQYTLKSDVYSFGVVMLELMTGRKPFDSTRPRPEQCLVRWGALQLRDIDALDNMVDPTLEGLYPAKALSRFADVIALCVQAEPEFRPPMSEVVQALFRLVQRAHMSKRTRSIDRLDTSRSIDELDTPRSVADLNIDN